MKSGLRNVIREGVGEERGSEVGKMALFGPPDRGQFHNFPEPTVGYPKVLEKWPVKVGQFLVFYCFPSCLVIV